MDKDTVVQLTLEMRKVHNPETNYYNYFFLAAKPTNTIRKKKTPHTNPSLQLFTLETVESTSHHTNPPILLAQFFQMYLKLPPYDTEFLRCLDEEPEDFVSP